MAFRAKEDASNHELSKQGMTFADDEWGIVEEAVYNARQRRLGLPDFGDTGDNEQREAKDEEGARRLGLPPSLSRGGEKPVVARLRYPGHEFKTTALHGLNAAKPEPVSADEVAAAQAARGGQAAPMRDVLIDLAAGWPIEGAEKGGRIANVLVKCADALKDAVAGKEGC